VNKVTAAAILALLLDIQFYAIVDWDNSFNLQTFPNLVKAGYVSFNTANGSPTPTSASIDKNTLALFYMTETPKRVSTVLLL